MAERHTPDFFTDAGITERNTNIFTNQGGNTLIRELEGELTNNPTIANFDAVVGFLRASGYFSLHPFLSKVKARILVGIDTDKYVVSAVASAKRYSDELPLEASEQAKNECMARIQEDIEKAGYKEDVEKGILKMVQDLRDKKLELRVHPSKKIHAKFYILYPNNYNRYSLATLITGSSNLSGRGLGTSPEQQYEFNVKISRFEDISYSMLQFNTLWRDGIEITADDISATINNTYLSSDASPYELYIKTLIEYFGERVVESVDNKNPLFIPDGYTKFQYQIDAAIEGYQKLLRYDGLFLADVVGLGKTIIATLIAEKFLVENGRENTKILVVSPPQVEENWKKTFHDFGVDKYAKFVTIGNLDKVLDEENYNYWRPNEYDLVIVDESHRFRNIKTNWFTQLQDICKAHRLNHGNIGGRKKVILVSATPMNNSIADIFTQICLFQDPRSCTIEGVSNLAAFFKPLVEAYEDLRDKEEFDVEEYKELSKKVRDRVIRPITIRRTRTDIEEIGRYFKEVGGFPQVDPPKKKSYELDKSLADLFEKSMMILVKKLHYVRYQAIAHLKPEFRKDYAQADIKGHRLAGIQKNRLVKRLESSFEAFKKSINNFRKANENMIHLFEDAKVVFITPDLDINKFFGKKTNSEDENDDDSEDEYSQEKLEETLRKIEEKLKEKPEGNKSFNHDCFDDDFIKLLHADQDLLQELCDDWENIPREKDPKFDKFKELLEEELFDKERNHEGKLVVFTESIDTANYLEDRIGRTDLLVVSSKNRKKLDRDLSENFDANYKVKKDKYNIVITTDVLAEGVNLHRANIIVNYDTPWNPTKLLQRIGRVNRIGSKSKVIYNYVFYPSREGNREIKLEEISLNKIQTFHSTFGGDNQIYSEDEVIERDPDRLFNEAKRQSEKDVNPELPYLEELRELYKNNPSEYRRIEKMSLRSRAGRQGRDVNEVKLRSNTLVFLKTNIRKVFFLVSDEAKELSVLEALECFKSDRSEPGVKRIPEHYDHVETALAKFSELLSEDREKGDDFQADLSTTGTKSGKGVSSLSNFLKSFRKEYPVESELYQKFSMTIKLVERGTSVRLNDRLRKILAETMPSSSGKKNQLSHDEAKEKLLPLVSYYSDLHGLGPTDKTREPETEVEIILSESFTQ